MLDQVVHHDARALAAVIPHLGAAILALALESLDGGAVDPRGDFLGEDVAVVAQRRDRVFDDGEDEGVVGGEAGGEGGPVDGRVTAGMPGFLRGGRAVRAAEEGLLAHGEAGGGFSGGVRGGEVCEERGGDWG